MAVTAVTVVTEALNTRRDEERRSSSKHANVLLKISDRERVLVIKEGDGLRRPRDLANITEDRSTHITTHDHRKCQDPHIPLPHLLHRPSINRRAHTLLGHAGTTNKVDAAKEARVLSPTPAQPLNQRTPRLVPHKPKTHITPTTS